MSSKIWVPPRQAELAEGTPAGRSGYILRIVNHLEISVVCFLNNPRGIAIRDFKTFGADVMLSSASMAQGSSAALNYHTTIPEQPPGRSWFTQVGIIKAANGAAFLIGQYCNMNTGNLVADNLGPAELDRWVNLGLKVVTKDEDASLSDLEFRIEYYVDGILTAARIPEDSAILIDPERTGLGPHRSLVVLSQANSTGEAVGYFDNVKAVYRNRTG